MNEISNVIGFVTQKPTIVDGTILENITMTSSTEVKHFEKQLNNALSMSGFEKVMNEKRMHLHSMVGPTTQGLSVGQEQNWLSAEQFF